MFSAKKVYAMLENESLWRTAEECHRLLTEARVPHAVMGGVAVCMHGYQRNTVDLDLLIRNEDSQTVRTTLEGAGFSWQADEKEFHSPGGVPVQFLYAGDRAGPGSEVLLPDPEGEGVIAELENLPALTLAKLIETKLACGMGNLRRTHKDFADVVELIAHNQLDSAFARFLHKSLRSAYRDLVRRSRA